MDMNTGSYNTEDIIQSIWQRQFVKVENSVNGGDKMNKRVRELAEQARDYTDKAIDCGWLNGDEIFEGKFAELIVLECAGVTLDYKNDDYYKGWCDHSAEILEHFGVK